jgi:hypothetical protein
MFEGGGRGVDFDGKMNFYGDKTLNMLPVRMRFNSASNM